MAGFFRRNTEENGEIFGKKDDSMNSGGCLLASAAVLVAALSGIWYMLLRMPEVPPHSVS